MNQSAVWAISVRSSASSLSEHLYWVARGWEPSWQSNEIRRLRGRGCRPGLGHQLLVKQLFALPERRTNGYPDILWSGGSMGGATAADQRYGECERSTAEVYGRDYGQRSFPGVMWRCSYWWPNPIVAAYGPDDPALPGCERGTLCIRSARCSGSILLNYW